MRSSNTKAVDNYRETLDENIYAMIEMGHQNHNSIMKMPVKRFYGYLEWKAKLEEEKRKKMDEEQTKYNKGK